MTLLHQLHADRISVAYGVHDALSARLAKRAGANLLWLSSLGLSLVHGLPDDEAMTVTEILEWCRGIRRATDASLLVDCDTGFGSSSSLVRLVTEARELGLDGICLQDQAAPKRNTFDPRSHSLAGVEEFSAKLDLARRVRGNSSVPALVARTESLAQGTATVAAVDRARAYVQAGADAVLLQTKDTDLRRINDFMGRWKSPTPVGLITTTMVGCSLSDYSQIGLNYVIFANQALRAAVHAMKTAYCHLLTEEGVLPSSVSMADVDELVQMFQQTYEQPVVGSTRAGDCGSGKQES